MSAPSTGREVMQSKYSTVRIHHVDVQRARILVARSTDRDILELAEVVLDVLLAVGRQLEIRGGRSPVGNIFRASV